MREFDLARHRGLGFLDKPDQIAVAHIGLDHHIALRVFPIDLDRAIDALDPRHTGQRHAGAIRQGKAQRGKVGRGIAQAGRTAQDHRHAPPLLDHRADRTSFQQGLQVILNGIDVEPEATGGQTIHCNLQVLHPVILQGEGIFRPRDGFDRFFDVDRQTVQGRQIGAEHLDRQIAPHAGEHFRDTHVDGLREGKTDPREIRHHRAHLIGQPGGIRHSPSLARRQHHEGIGLVEAHRVQAQFIRTGPRHNRLHFRHLGQDGLLHGGIDGDGLIEADRGQLFQLHDQIAFIHGRHEALAEQAKGTASSQQGQHGARHIAPAVRQGRGEQAVIARRELAHQPGLGVHTALDQPGREHRHHGQRQQQRTGQGKDNGQRHRPEHLAFQALQGQQRQKDQNDDQDAGRHRGCDLTRRPEHQVQGRQVVRCRGELTLDVFDHHHSSIDQHADGDGQPAQAHQVGRKPHAAHQDEGGQRRQGQHQRDDQRRAQVAEEGEQ